MSTRRAVFSSFTARMMAQLFGVVTGTVLLCVGALTFLTAQRVNDQAELQALSIARTLAADPSLHAQVQELDGQRHPDPSALAEGPIERNAEAVRSSSGALFVVVTNDLGVRLSHPNPDLLGQRVSTTPQALDGQEHVARERGTLGESVRAKVPVTTSTGKVIGEVSVGVAVTTVARQVRQAILSVLLVGMVSLVLTWVAAVTLVRRLRRVTLGLEPEDMAQLVRDQEAVLYGVDDGVIGIGPQGRISLRNESARSLLNLPGRREPGDVVGLPYEEAGLPEPLVRAVDERRSAEGSTARAAVGDVVPVRLELEQGILMAGVRDVTRDGTNLGQVIVLRDLTAIETLGNRLNAVETMAGALRTQRHEFGNRLHTISGLLNNGDVEHAQSYLADIISTGPVRDPVENIAAVTDPYLRAFLGAKGVEARDRGVTLRVGPQTALLGTLHDAHDVTAVLGNLLDNAVGAAAEAPGPAWVEVDLLGEGDTLHIAVADSGTGVVPGLDVFAEGTTTRPGADTAEHGHGVGLALCRRLARMLGGDLWIAAQGGDALGVGAVFVARLPGTLDPHGDATTTEDGGRVTPDA